MHISPLNSGERNLLMTRRTILGVLKEIRGSTFKEKYKIFIRDRLVEGGTRVITGDQIDEITQFDQIILKEGSVIPIHRIIKIEIGNRVIIDRKTAEEQ